MNRGRSAVLGAFIAALATCVLAPSAANAGTLDQQQLLQNSNQLINGPATPRSVAQTFTAGITGRLDQVDLKLTFGGIQPTLPLTVEIRNVTGGQPSTVLATATVPTPAPIAFEFVPVPFPGAAPVTAGVQYAIVAYSATSDTHQWVWRGVTGSNPYAGGEMLFATSSPPSTTWGPFAGGADQAFKTYVTPAAAPGPTGKRAAALKKCKKKHKKNHNNTEFKKCKKKAKKLPA